MSRFTVGIVGAFVCFLAFFGSDSMATAQTTIKLYNGPPQGSWRPFANAFKRAIEKEITGAKVKILPGGGLSNVIAIEGGKGDIGMVASAPLYSGFEGKGAFKKKTQNVRVLATLYVQPVYLMTFDPGIKRVEDFKGKRISVMPKGYAAERVNQLILKLAGLTYADVKEQFLGEVDSVGAMRDGHIDIYMGMGSVPYSSAIDLATTGKLRFVNMSDGQFKRLRSINKGFFPYNVKGGTYRGISQDYRTFAVTVLMIGNANFSNDKAKGVTKALVDLLPEMQKNFTSFKVMTPKDMAQDIGIPFHPGSLAYYRSSGIIK